jgi:EREBP-like factor
MMEPMEQEHHGDEPPMIREIMKRWKHERKFSASLYAYNGVSECLRLAFRPGMPAAANGGYELPSNLGINSNNNEEEKKRDDMGKDAKEEVQEEVEIPQTPTEKGSSSSSSSLSKEDGELSLWSSLDLPPICFNNI